MNTPMERRASRPSLFPSVRCATGIIPQHPHLRPKQPKNSCGTVTFFRSISGHPETAMQSSIVGTTMPVLEFVLEPNESVVSEAGELSWMTSSIQMETHTQFGGGGGFFGALK